MKLEMLKSKLHQACVTHADVAYEGSLGIDTELMDAVGFYPYEKVLVANLNNGSRLETYVIPAPAGSRKIILNGAAARLGAVRDRIIIMSFAWVDRKKVETGTYKPNVIRLDEDNEPVQRLFTAEESSKIAPVLSN